MKTIVIEPPLQLHVEPIPYILWVYSVDISEETNRPHCARIEWVPRGRVGEMKNLSFIYYDKTIPYTDFWEAINRYVWRDRIRNQS